jgi:apolipoprotein N-acyltransferase
MSALASAMLLVLCLPPADAGALAWLALVPLLIGCRGLSAARSAALGSLFGVVSSLGIFSWLAEVPAIGAPQMAVLAAYVSLYPALWCAGLPRLQRSRMPLALTAPAWWVALDALKAHAGFLALPWGTLAQSQHENIALLQLASLTGEAGVNFIVVMVNVAIAQAVGARRITRSLAAAVAVALAGHAGGAHVLASEDTNAPRIAVTAIQPALAIGTRDTPVSRAAAWQRLEALTLEAARTRPALIVWPETVVADPAHDPELAARLATLARDAGAPIVVGAAQAAKFATAGADGGVTLGRRALHNAALLLRPDGRSEEPYLKRRLVPFAETTPLRDRLTWPAWLVPAAAHGEAGTQARRWTLDDGVRVAPLICWENLFAGLARDAVRDGAQVLVQLTDDAWFGRSAASRQHNLASVLRAVENRVPLVIASNGGPSMVIDRRGRVVALANAGFGTAVVSASVAAGTAVSPYTRGGEWFAVLCVLSIVCAGAPSNLRSKR